MSSDTADASTGFFAPRGKAAAAALAALALTLLAFAAPAHAATYEQVGVFGGSATPQTPEEIEADEEVQLGGVGGLAVNRSGAGGVPKGTVYAVAKKTAPPYVAMYVPKPAGGLEFRAKWEVTREAEPSYERCGPLVEEEREEESKCGANADNVYSRDDVVVDQASGNVFALTGSNRSFSQYAVTEFSADGAEEITRFAEIAPGGETVAESPEMVHGYAEVGDLAINAEGWVYVFDQYNFTPRYHRLMVFEPESPGDYEHYAYAGEVAGSTSTEHLPSMPVADEAGNIYVAGSEETQIEEYPHEAPGHYPHPSTPSCTFEYSKGGIPRAQRRPRHRRTLLLLIQEGIGGPLGAPAGALRRRRIQASRQARIRPRTRRHLRARLRPRAARRARAPARHPVCGDAKQQLRNRRSPTRHPPRLHLRLADRRTAPGGGRVGVGQPRHHRRRAAACPDQPRRLPDPLRLPVPERGRI